MTQHTSPFRGPSAIRRSAPLLTLVLVIAGCATGATPAPSSSATAGAPGPATTGPASSDPNPAASAVPSGSGTAPQTPGVDPVVEALAAQPWAAASLTDVSTGETFTIASLGGRTIFVETMAIWCSSCRAQQGRFRDALSQLEADRVAYVVLAVDPSEGADALARYKAERGFVGRYAVAGRDVSAALAEAFGPNVLNPPSVPLIRIGPDGSITFSTGGESVEQIIQLVSA